MLLRRAILLLSAISSSLAAPVLNKRAGPTRGVNLGGWLVLEPWITPSIFHKYDGFTIVDEYTLCQNDPNAAAVLQAHWSSWITLADFQKIAATNKGINTVRIPVGYWAFQKYPGDTYVQGAKDYLAQALDWASQTGLKVWIDLHGAPLSQNGFDNSGRRGGMAWTSADTISFTAGVISQVAGEFGNHPAVAGIELVNEPMMGSLPGGRSAVENYYGQGDAAVHAASGAGVIIHDGFADPGSWAGIDPDTTIDHHAYQVFTSGDLELTYQQHADTAYGRATSWTNSGRNVVVGEWTAAMTDCAPALNGYGIGARYDGTYSAPGLSSYFIGSCAIQNFIDEWTPELKAGTTQFIQAQMNAYETNLGGWIFWTVKTEASAEWDFFRLVDNGVWP